MIVLLKYILDFLDIDSSALLLKGRNNYICPNRLTHIEFNDMCFGDERHPILKKKSTRHLSAWKFDTSRAVLQRGLENGYTIYVPVNSDGTYSTENIGEFFEKHFTT